MPAVKIDDLASSRPTEYTLEQMKNLHGGTSELRKDPMPNDFCATPVPSPFPFLDPTQLPVVDSSQFPWNDEVPSDPAGPCGPSELIAR